MQDIAIIGGGVSGLTCGVLLAEHGSRVTIVAEQVGQDTTSGAAAAIWFPYDAEPFDKVLAWALVTYERFRELALNARSGVSMIELRQFARAGEIPIPVWAEKLGAARIAELPPMFASGFGLKVPLTDTTIYLNFLARRFQAAGGAIQVGTHINRIDDLDCDLVVNCTGIGARILAHDIDLDPHRGQVVVVPKLHLSHAIVCDDPPLMYAIPRSADCVFGGTNQISDDLKPRAAETDLIVNECSRVLAITAPKIFAERVGLRPFRKTGIRLEVQRLADGRSAIHNYGHGGSGFTLSFGCAEEVLNLAAQLR